MAIAFVGSAGILPARAQTFTVLHNFTNGADGSLPQGGLIRDGAGNLYGAASAGGVAHNGVLFKLDPSGHETVLYAFKGGTDGSGPYGDLVEDEEGNFYGTTLYGGNTFGYYGCGTIFKFDRAGHESLVHIFHDVDGCNPAGGLTRDSAGNLYGVTQNGGNVGIGTLFRLDRRGKLTVLHHFGGPPRDGDHPDYLTVPVLDSQGNLYGITPRGGTFDLGVVYMLSMDGQYSLLHTFVAGSDGCKPEGNLLLDSHRGLLYGTTEAHCPGPPSGWGTIWRINLNKQQKTLVYTFSGGADGWGPNSLIPDDSGGLIGVTYQGGEDFGTIFQMNRDGQEVVLHNFAYSDGRDPSGTLLRTADHELYGTTLLGGPYDYGTIWKLVP